MPRSLASGAAVAGAGAGPEVRFRASADSVPTWDRPATFDDFDGAFQFCRLQFRNGSNGDGAGWGVDWPRADQNLSIRLSELTRTPVSMNEADEPNSLLLTRHLAGALTLPLRDDDRAGRRVLRRSGSARLFARISSRAGFSGPTTSGATYAWDYWENEIRKVLPSGAVSDLRRAARPSALSPDDDGAENPADSFDWFLAEPPAARPSVGADSAVPHVRAINDANGRIMVLMTHNTDFGDAYEREGDDHEYFERFSVPGYAFGVNVLLYMMSH